MKRLTKFLRRCRQQLKNEKNLFWASLQSNLLADLSIVEKDFQKAVQVMKEQMKTYGWILPTLKANMRNQVNIANVQVKGISKWQMQSSIAKLASGTSLIGEIPILFTVQWNHWYYKKEKVLKHCIDLISTKNEKNIVVLWDEDFKFKSVADDIRKVINDKKIVSYPSKQNRKNGILGTIVSKFFPTKQSEEEGMSAVKHFVEKSEHILVTKNHYFNGCECANVIYLTCCNESLRNSVLRGVQNIICVQLTGNDNEAIINGMKEDNRFRNIECNQTRMNEEDRRFYEKESETVDSEKDHYVSNQQ